MPINTPFFQSCRSEGETEQIFHASSRHAPVKSGGADMAAADAYNFDEAVNRTRHESALGLPPSDKLFQRMELAGRLVRRHEEDPSLDEDALCKETREDCWTAGVRGRLRSHQLHWLHDGPTRAAPPAWQQHVAGRRQLLALL